MPSTNATQSPREVAALVVVHRPVAGRTDDYEAWLQGVRCECQRFPGHIGADVIRPSSDQDQAYTVVVRFHSKEGAEAWLESTARRDAVARLSR